MVWITLTWDPGAVTQWTVTQRYAGLPSSLVTLGFAGEPCSLSGRHASRSLYHPCLLQAPNSQNGTDPKAELSAFLGPSECHDCTEPQLGSPSPRRCPQMPACRPLPQKHPLAAYLQVLLLRLLLLPRLFPMASRCQITKTLEQ